MMEIKLLATTLLVISAVLFILTTLGRVDAKPNTSIKWTIIHNTDVHGWIYGHRHNATLNTDYGDYYNLMTHMYNNAKANNEELFFLNTGDLVEGTGLSDATPIHGQDIFPIMAQVPTSAFTAGNHDVEDDDTVTLMHDTFIPKVNHFITSNLIYKPTNDFLGEPYAVIDTELGHRVLLLGFIYNFTQNSNNTIVIPVEEAVTLPSFIEAMKVPNVDLIVALNHIDPLGQYDTLHTIYKAVREYYPTKPFILLSGHAHQLVYRKYDDNSFTLESGCYFQTLGMINFALTETGEFDYWKTQWVDTSLDNFLELAQTTNATFGTPQGASIKKQINQYIQHLDLDEKLGYNKIVTFNPWYPMDNPASFYRLLVQDIFPKTVLASSSEYEQLSTAASTIPFYITNTGFLRYELYTGLLLLDDIYTIDPFKDTYYYYQNISGAVMSQLMDKLINLPSVEVFERYGDWGTQRALDAGRYARGGSDAAADDILPSWVSTMITLDPDASYDLIAADYDCFTIGPLLNQIDPSRTYTRALFPTTFTTTTSLQAYVTKFMPLH